MSDHGDRSDAEVVGLPGLVQIVDTYMHRILDSGEGPVDVISELMGALTQPPLFDRLWCVGDLYASFGVLSDIVDGYPVDYGTSAEAIAWRETRDAARDWLANSRTAEGMKQYLDRWDTRLAALPVTYGGRLVRVEQGQAADSPPKP